MKRTGQSVIAEGRWLVLNEIEYEDAKHRKSSWESVSRRNCAGAVAMIAVLRESKRIILVRQYRPPADAFMIEFPAGLIDKGESPEATAVRELREETGYTGVVRRMLPPAYNSPGLTSEYVYIAIMDVPEHIQDDIRTDFDENEDIETILVPLDALSGFLDDAAASGSKIDGKLSAFAAFQRITGHF